MVTPRTRCSVCVIFEKLSVHLWMLGFDLGFMSCFFLSDEAFNKKIWKKAPRSAVIFQSASQLLCFMAASCFSVLKPLLWEHLLCTKHPPRSTHTEHTIFSVAYYLYD